LEKTASKEEIDLARETLDTAMSDGLIDRIRQEHLLLYLLRKRLAAAGISAEISLVAISSPNAAFDPKTEVVQSVDLQMLLEQIKLDLAKEKGDSGGSGKSSSTENVNASRRSKNASPKSAND
jgi:hypothetical protein